MVFINLKLKGWSNSLLRARRCEVLGRALQPWLRCWDDAAAARLSSVSSHPHQAFPAHPSVCSLGPASRHCATVVRDPRTPRAHRMYRNATRETSNARCNEMARPQNPGAPVSGQCVHIWHLSLTAFTELGDVTWGLAISAHTLGS